MSIYEKIEEIRQKPEHIRMRYVWGSVVVCMFFVILIWFFSFWSSAGKDGANLNEEVEVFDDFSERKRTLDSYQEQVDDVKEEIRSLQKETLEQEQVNPDSETENNSLAE